MSYTIRRSLPAMALLVAILVGVGYAAVITVHAPLWLPIAFAVLFVGLEYLIGPWILEHLTDVRHVAFDGTSYAVDHPVGAMVQRRAGEARIPLPQLGIVEDDAPNAYTFGRSPKSARLYVTRGLLDRLDERELDAVVTHEIGHIKHWDFVVMTIVALVPLILYWLYIVARGSGRREAAPVMIGAYAGYLVSQLTVLAVSRAREYAADRYSCACTADGDALASALVKIAYGIGTAQSRYRDELLLTEGRSKEARRARSNVERRERRVQSMRVMGIFEPRAAEAMAASLSSGADPDHVLGGMRWESLNPWGRVLEKVSTHPLVVHRIASLERSGLPGAPQEWSVLRRLASIDTGDRSLARRSFAKDVVVALAPWLVFIPVTGYGLFTQNRLTTGMALCAAGALFLLKQALVYRRPFMPVDRVADLLHRVDASPISGIPVSIRGRVIGRGMPGYALSPDIVIQDESGFLPLLYLQPVPFASFFFALTKVRELLGAEVVATGWYRRMPGPVIELNRLDSERGIGTRVYWSTLRWICSFGVLAVGVVMLAAGAGQA
jgi:Zn-dependent protease with chaperone function